MDSDDVGERTYSPAADKAGSSRDDKQKRHHTHKRQDLRQDEIVGAVYTHNLHGIYLLGHAHRTYLRRDVRTHFAGKYQTENRAGELQQQCVARQQTCDVGRQQGVLGVRLRLDGKNSTDKYGNQQHNR